MQSPSSNLSLLQKASWGLADMGIVVFVIVKQLLVLSFLTNYLGIPVGIAGALTTAVLVLTSSQIRLSGIYQTAHKAVGGGVRLGWRWGLWFWWRG